MVVSSEIKSDRENEFKSLGTQKVNSVWAMYWAKSPFFSGKCAISLN